VDLDHGASFTPFGIKQKFLINKAQCFTKKKRKNLFSFTKAKVAHTIMHNDSQKSLSPSPKP
jgi:hypothetical protein